MKKFIFYGGLISKLIQLLANKYTEESGNQESFLSKNLGQVCSTSDSDSIRSNRKNLHSKVPAQFLKLHKLRNSRNSINLKEANYATSKEKIKICLKKTTSSTIHLPTTEKANSYSDAFISIFRSFDFVSSIRVPICKKASSRSNK